MEDKSGVLSRFYEIPRDLPRPIERKKPNGAGDVRMSKGRRGAVRNEGERMDKGGKGVPSLLSGLDFIRFKGPRQRDTQSWNV